MTAAVDSEVVLFDQKWNLFFSCLLKSFYERVLAARTRSRYHSHPPSLPLAAAAAACGRNSLLQCVSNVKAD